MDSDDDGFHKQGEALDIGEDFDSDEGEEDVPIAASKAPPAKKPAPAPMPKKDNVRGETVQN